MSNYISLAKAKEMISAYRKNKNEVFNNKYTAALPEAETFDKEQLQRIMSGDDCTAIRVYYGMSDIGDIHSIMVGVNAANEDIIPINNSDSYTGIIEEAQRCPPYCAVHSPLTDNQ